MLPLGELTFSLSFVEALLQLRNLTLEFLNLDAQGANSGLALGNNRLQPGGLLRGIVLSRFCCSLAPPVLFEFLLCSPQKVKNRQSLLANDVLKAHS